MKKILVVLPLLAIAFQSCIWDRGDEEPRPTDRGFEIFQTWNAYTNSLMRGPVDMAFKLNAWLAAPDDSARYEIEDRYFPQQRIRDYGNNIYAVMLGDEELYTFNTGGLSLSDSGSTWQVSGRFNQCLDMDRYMPLLIDRKLLISSGSDYTWHIAFDTVGAKETVVDWTLASNDGVPVDLARTSCQMSGTGGYFTGCNDDTILISFGITEPLVSETISNAKYRWRAGAMHITVSHAQDDPIDVDARFLNEKEVRIGYMGLVGVY